MLNLKSCPKSSHSGLTCVASHFGPNIHHAFGVLFIETMSPRTFKNHPIWSHCFRVTLRFICQLEIVKFRQIILRLICFLFKKLIRFQIKNCLANDLTRNWRILIFVATNLSYGQTRPLLLFSFLSQYSTIYYKWKKRKWCAWDSNPGPQNWRCRLIHWAMAAPILELWVGFPRQFLIK